MHIRHLTVSAPMLVACILAASTPASAASADEPAPPETRSCLENRAIRARDVSAANGYFARTPQGWWRNTGPSCAAYGHDRALITRSTQDRQCQGDVVEVFDMLTRITFGACILGAWERVSAPPKN